MLSNVERMLRNETDTIGISLSRYKHMLDKKIKLVERLENEVTVDRLKYEITLIQQYVEGLQKLSETMNDIEHLIGSDE